MKYSVVICTANRPDPLAQTLGAFSALAAPPGGVELLVVDNGPSEETAAVVRGASLPQFDVRVVGEPRRGVAWARNRGLAEARGEILLTTDDDVHPPADWIARLCAPLLWGDADMVVGGIRVAPALLRPWMRPHHLSLLASTEWVPSHQSIGTLIGANMAVHRRVLRRVPAYDVELGPGTFYGGGEEVLLFYQLREAGFRLASLNDVFVEHHFEASRLGKEAFRSRVTRTGREHAYIKHHWEQEPFQHVPQNLVRSFVEWRRARQETARTWPGDEGLPERELKAIEWHTMYRQYLTERRKTPHYERRGLVKVRGVLPSLSSPALAAA